MIQLQFLNKLLDSKDSSILLVNNITDEFFSEYKNEFNFILDHIKMYNAIPDKETFGNMFQDFTFINVSEPLSYLVDELYTDRNKRMLAKIFNNVRNLLNAGKVDEAMQEYLKSADSAVTAKHLDSINILADTSRYADYIDRCNNFNKFYVKTGFSELDQVIGGWDRQEELATIVARPNIGKSWLLLKFAVAAVEQNLRVGIYSGEMSEKKVGYRVDTLISHISNGGIIHGNSKFQNEYKRYIDALPAKYSGFIKVLTPAMIGGTAGVTALRAFIEKEKLDILFIDQHSLLEDDRKAKNAIEKAANISKDLKTLQVLKKIPIIAVSQQNRADTSEKGVDVSNIAQSDRIGQDSTIVLFLEKKDDVMILTLVKSRDTENGKKLKYAVDFNKGTFLYIPEEGNAVEGLGVATLSTEFGDDGQTVFS